ITKENKNAKIVLFGGSMGGAAVMMATGEPLPANVVCAVEDCGFSSFWDEYAYQAKTLLHIPVFPALYAMDAFVRLRQGFSMKDASCVEQVKKSRTPTLFLHGEADDAVPFRMLDELYEAAACEKEKCTFPGAGHGESAYQAQRYYGAIKRFAGRYLEASK
ncbi:MAG: lysophospholipase, partial [Firmicutes bacterium]|nr:lysophospholipase [Bacillota bacterium]